jgi:hypothetical protein
MARIELRDCIVRVKDGLSGSAAVNQAATPPAEGDTSLTIDNVQLNTRVATQVPKGARFTVAGETDAVEHVVTERTPAAGGPTTDITFSPALGAGTYADGALLTFLPQQIEIKVGGGNLTYSEKNEYNYELDRGNLDSVREGDEQPMEVKLECVYEHITTGTDEPITPMDAIKGKGAAAEWVSSSADKCEPYAVDIEVEHIVPCGTSQNEITLFPDFRSESRDVDLKEATIAISGKCNATEPIVIRE